MQNSSSPPTAQARPVPTNTPASTPTMSPITTPTANLTNCAARIYAAIVGRDRAGPEQYRSRQGPHPVGDGGAACGEDGIRSNFPTSRARFWKVEGFESLHPLRGKAPHTGTFLCLKVGAEPLRGIG